MRLLLAGFLVVHGIAHLVGFLIPWRLITSADVPYRTTILAGSVDVGDMGIRSLGLVWLVLALGFVALGVALLSGHWSYPMALGIVLASLTMCAVGLPEARIGLALNTVLAIVLIVANQLRWMPIPGR